MGDRTNNRLQIFSPDGEFIAYRDHWGRPSGVRILNDVLYVVDSSHAPPRASTAITQTGTAGFASAA